MGKHSKKKTNRAGQAEVLTGHDEKAERESPDRRLWERESDRPNGTSGNYSGSTGALHIRSAPVNFEFCGTKAPLVSRGELSAKLTEGIKI